VYKMNTVSRLASVESVEIRVCACMHEGRSIKIRGRDRITFGFIKCIQLLTLVHHISHWPTFKTMSKVVMLTPFHALVSSRYCAENHLTDESDGLHL
jgi:hypothetical protein